MDDAADAVAVPRHLYKYRSLAGSSKDWARDLIQHQRLFFPGPADLNDPFECKPFWGKPATSAAQLAYAKGLAKRMAPNAPRSERRRVYKKMVSSRGRFLSDMERATSETLNRVGIYSLTTKPLDLLMWPHYGNNHRGVCVRFDVDALTMAGMIPFPVDYSETRPVCDTMIEPAVEWLEKAVLTKGIAWAYEDEWRIVENRGARKLVTPLRPVIDGVLLGANISPQHRDEVLSWASLSPGPVAVAQAEFDEREYRLKVRDLDELKA